MLLDARQLEDGSLLTARLCIVGGGMAAIAIARELRTSGIKVLVLEAGGEEPSAEMQAFYQGTGIMRNMDGQSRDMTAYLAGSRVRAFGGSGHVWGGKCGRLDLPDFLARDWIPGSGWPFERETLDPFYDRASSHLELPAFTTDLVNTDPARPPLRVGTGQVFETVPRFHSQVSGSHSREKFNAYRFSITEAPETTVCLHASVTQVRLTGDGRAVQELEIRTLNGKRHRAQADHYILATGGMENARLLLLSNQQERSGVANQRGLVGRYFGGHLNAAMGGGDDTGPASGMLFAELTQTFDLYTENDIRKVWGIWNATPQGQRRYRLPNVWVAFTRRQRPLSPAEESIIRLARVTRSVPARSAGDFVPARIMAEQPPNPESRLTLDSTAVDGLSQPRLNLDWQLNREFFDGLDRSAAALGRAVAETGMGRWRWPSNETSCSTGSTRPGITWGQPGCTGIHRKAWSMSIARCMG
jgi:hypothetical protein